MADSVGKKVKADLYGGSAVVMFAYGLSGSGKTFTIFGPDAPDSADAWFKHSEPHKESVFENRLNDICDDSCIPPLSHLSVNSNNAHAMAIIPNVIHSSIQSTLFSKFALFKRLSKLSEFSPISSGNCNNVLPMPRAFHNLFVLFEITRRIRVFHLPLLIIRGFKAQSGHLPEVPLPSFLLAIRGVGQVSGGALLVRALTVPGQRPDSGQWYLLWVPGPLVILL